MTSPFYPQLSGVFPRSLNNSIAGLLAAALALAQVGSRTSLQQAPGDDQALDLARALPDPVDANLAVVPVGHVLLHEPTPAEDLQSPIRHARDHLGGEKLG